MRGLKEDADFGRELSMSVPGEDIIFETSLSLPLSLSAPTVIRPPGAKASKDASVGRPLVTNGPGFVQSSEFALGTNSETNSEFEIVLSASEITSTSFELTSEQSVLSVSSDVAVDGSTSSAGTESVAEVNTVTEASLDSISLEPLAPEINSVSPAQMLTPAPTVVAVSVDSKAAKESFVEVDIMSTDSESFGVPTPPTDTGFSGKSGKTL